jgi:hypothetical protein
VPIQLAQVWTRLCNCSKCEQKIKHRTQFIINIYLISNDQNYSKFNISSTLGLKIYEITSKKSHSSMVFLSYQDLTPISLNFMILIRLDFQLQNCSIFNNSCNVSLNIAKPPWCTPAHQRLSNDTNSMIRVPWFGRFSTWQTNKQLP